VSATAHTHAHTHTLKHTHIHTYTHTHKHKHTFVGDGTKIMTSDASLSMLLTVLRERHCAALFSWPAQAGGGAEGVAAVVLNVVDVLQVCVCAYAHVVAVKQCAGD